MRNLSAHRVDADGLLTSGGDTGVLAALVAAVVPTIVAPIFVSTIDGWTFFKAVSTILLGDSAVDPVSGFELAPVLVGAGMYLFIGTLLGAIFALVVALADLDGAVPILVILISLFGAYTFLLLWLPLSQTLVPAFDLIPTPFAGWMIVTYAIMLVVGIAGWGKSWDSVTSTLTPPSRTRLLLHAHERAIVSTLATIVMVSVGVLLAETGEVRVAAALTFLLLQVAVCSLAIAHARAEHQTLQHLSSAPHDPGRSSLDYSDVP
jgi:hypothetical protein